MAYETSQGRNLEAPRRPALAVAYDPAGYALGVFVDIGELIDPPPNDGRSSAKAPLTELHRLPRSARLPWSRSDPVDQLMRVVLAFVNERPQWRICNADGPGRAATRRRPRLTLTPGPTTIGHECKRQPCRRLRVRGRDRRVRRPRGLQRDNGRLRRCVGHRGARALRGAGARGPGRARAADQVDRRRGDVRVPRSGDRPADAGTPASGVPRRAVDSADPDRAQPRPGAAPGERPLRLDRQRRGTRRRAGVGGAGAGDPAGRRRRRGVGNRRAGPREGGAAIDRGRRAAVRHRAGAGLRSRLDRSGVQDARALCGVPQSSPTGPWFCSERCAEAYRRSPEAYRSRAKTPGPG